MDMGARIERFLARFGRICGKTGRFRAFRARGLSRFLLPLIGLASLIWFVIRVAPKPSRAAYPCMRAAAPLASGFLVWLAGIPILSLAAGKLKKALRRGWIIGVAIVGLAAGGMLWSAGRAQGPSFPDAVVEAPNRPMGKAQGIFPGRVVWAWNPEATNENCTNRPGDGWFLPRNTNQPVIDGMLSDGLRSLTGKKTDAEAWNAIFRFHNGGAGYSRGQKFFIKINATSAWSGNFNPYDLSVVSNNYYGVAETSPAIVLSVLRQLVNVFGISQADIFIGDPMKHIYSHSYDLWHAEFPGVHYMDNSYDTLGREKVQFTPLPVIFYSDRGTVMRAGTLTDSDIGGPTLNDRLCTLFQTCDYVINIPAMKGHKRAGVTMFAKNNFGSNSRENAAHLHGGLVNPTENNPSRQGYGLYRVQVDLMGDALLGGKNLFCLMDALFAGPEAVYPPTKWRTAPFDNDWTSSLFLSQDPVAIESVGYDFLRTEYTADTPYSWVQMKGVDDYLRQAADSSAWPKGIVYDPENDGTPLTSLGVHEHWNNADAKQYSRNLGTGNGIELVGVEKASFVNAGASAGAPAI
jgi:hypothetical protein